MPIFLLELPADAGFTRKRGANFMVVSAENVADARAIAKTQFTGAASDAAWDAATATTLTDITLATTGALVGWKFKIQLFTPANALLEEVEVTGVASTLDIIDEIGTQLAVLLNATSSIANASYTAATQALIVAAAADNLGDHRLVVEITPPEVVRADGTLQNQPDPIASLVSATADEGTAGDAVAVTFRSDAYVLPQVVKTADVR